MRFYVSQVFNVVQELPGGMSEYDQYDAHKSLQPVVKCQTTEESGIDRNPRADPEMDPKIPTG